MSITKFTQTYGNRESRTFAYPARKIKAAFKEFKLDLNEIERVNKCCETQEEFFATKYMFVIERAVGIPCGDDVYFKILKIIGAKS